mmetsp:Transcript_11115/g.25183  ORF Transcript_11115/g.25183 Transcript_11115/m.25183 type:complete len:141 (+) Transcript_11115:2019-2441(+)
MWMSWLLWQHHRGPPRSRRCYNSAGPASQVEEVWGMTSVHANLASSKTATSMAMGHLALKVRCVTDAIAHTISLAGGGTYQVPQGISAANRQGWNAPPFHLCLWHEAASQSGIRLSLLETLRAPWLDVLIALSLTLRKLH